MRWLVDGRSKDSKTSGDEASLSSFSACDRCGKTEVSILASDVV
jgi:hypothetical protein